MQVPTYLPCVLSLGEAFRYLIGSAGKICGLGGWIGGRPFARLHDVYRPVAHRLMRNGPHKPTRPLSRPAQDDENRAGIRALDCGEEPEAPVVIRRADASAAGSAAEPPVVLGEQRQSV